MNNREFFNAMAEKWDSTVNHDGDKIKSILTMVGLDEGNHVLDVGTGTGVMIPFLHDYIGFSGSITAVDEAEKMIDIASRKFPYENVRFIAADVLNMKLPYDFFDCVMCYSMFPHFSDKKAAVDKLSSTLKKDGKLVICHSQSRDAINKLHREASEAVKNDRLPPAEQISQYFHCASLKTIAIVDNEEMYVVIGQKGLG